MLAAVSYYFPGGSKWDDVNAVSPDVMAWLICNPDSGPGYGHTWADGGTHHELWKAQIDESQNIGHRMLAYVTTNYHDADSIQRQFRFAATPRADTFAKIDTAGTALEHGLPTGFGPVRVFSEGTLPPGLAPGTDYWIISGAPDDDATFRLADSSSHALDGTAVAVEGGGDGVHALGISRSPENVQNVLDEVDLYLQRYPTLHGFFFDEMNNDDTEENLEYYRFIYDHVHARGLVVVQNPGTNFPRSMVEHAAGPVADTFMSFEGEFDIGDNPYSTFTPPPWQADHPPTRFWHCVKKVPPARLEGAYQRRLALGPGYVWIDEADAEYTRPPSYLASLEEREAARS